MAKRELTDALDAEEEKEVKRGKVGSKSNPFSSKAKAHVVPKKVENTTKRKDVLQIR